MTPRYAPRTAFALDRSRPGQRVRVADVEGGPGLRARLSALGLVPGVTFEIVSANGGPLILNVMGSRLMLGRGMAAKILVRESAPRPEPQNKL